ncbi:MAG: MFS transporter [Synechococcaceae bacterium WB8_1B_136]|nr:MFS transporter [Synechococcaceae bacterium WB8_1B_136]
MLKRLRALPRDVWLVGLISLVNDGASDLIYPLLPLYLTAVLTAGPRALGLIEGIAEATSSLLKLVSGALSDRSGRSRPWIVTGYGMAGLARPLIALAASWPAVLLLRFTDRVGKGLRSSPRDALLAAVVAPDQRGLAFGLHRAMDNAGAVVGPLVAAGLLALQVPLRQLIAWSLLPGVVCTLLALALREPGAVPPPAPRTRPAPPVRWQFSALPPALQRYLPVVALFTLANSSNLFLLLRARELGVPQAQIPLLWAAISAVAMVGSTPLAAWSDRIGRRRLLLAGYGGYGIFYLLIGQLHSSGPWLLPLFASYGLFLSATEGVEKALVADLSTAGSRGTAFGWFNLITGLMVLPASVLFGWLYEQFSPQLAFTGGGCCALAAALWLARLPLPPGSGLIEPGPSSSA